eukprot:364400-Chlamydomonas_euryale.AAC.4
MHPGGRGAPPNRGRGLRVWSSPPDSNACLDFGWMSLDCPMSTGRSLDCTSHQPARKQVSLGQPHVHARVPAVLQPPCHVCKAGSQPEHQPAPQSVPVARPGKIPPPTHHLRWLCNNIEAVTHRRTGQRLGVVVLGASSPTLVDAATAPEASPTVALLASLSRWEWPSPNWLDAILSTP